jgi:hypothetical protein
VLNASKTPLSSSSFAEDDDDVVFVFFFMSSTSPFFNGDDDDDDDDDINTLFFTANSFGKSNCLKQLAKASDTHSAPPSL